MRIANLKLKLNSILEINGCLNSINGMKLDPSILMDLGECKSTYKSYIEDYNNVIRDLEKEEYEAFKSEDIESEADKAIIMKMIQNNVSTKRQQLGEEKIYEVKVPFFEKSEIKEWMKKFNRDKNGDRAFEPNMEFFTLMFPYIEETE